MASIKVLKNCETQLQLSWYGIVLPSENRNVELEFIDSDISKIRTLDPETNQIITINEVIFTVKCEDGLRSGTHTELVRGMESASSIEIFEAARAQIAN